MVLAAAVATGGNVCDGAGDADLGKAGIGGRGEARAAAPERVAVSGGAGACTAAAANGVAATAALLDNALPLFPAVLARTCACAYCGCAALAAAGTDAPIIKLGSLAAILRISFASSLVMPDAPIVSSARSTESKSCCNAGGKLCVENLPDRSSNAALEVWETLIT